MVRFQSKIMRLVFVGACAFGGLASCGGAEDGKHRTVVKIKGECLAFKRTEGRDKLKGRYGRSHYWFDHSVELDDGEVIETRISFQSGGASALDGASAGYYLHRRCKPAGAIHGLNIMVQKRADKVENCNFGPAKILTPMEGFPEISDIRCGSLTEALPLCSMRMQWATWKLDVSFPPPALERWELVASSVLEKLEADAEVLGKC